MQSAIQECIKARLGASGRLLFVSCKLALLPCWLFFPFLPQILQELVVEWVEVLMCTAESSHTDHNQHRTTLLADAHCTQPQRTLHATSALQDCHKPPVPQALTCSLARGSKSLILLGQRPGWVVWAEQLSGCLSSPPVFISHAAWPA